MFVLTAFPVRRRPHRRQAARLGRAMAGISMVEVLVAMLVTSVGLLAMAGLSSSALRYSRTSEFRSEANMLISDIADRMRANLGGMTSYAYAPTALATSAPTSATACVTTTACTPTEIATLDLQTWQRTLFTHLPNGTGYVLISSESSRLIDIWVMWTDPAALSGGSSSEWGNYVNAGTDGRTCPPGFNTMDPLPRCVYMRVGL